MECWVLLIRHTVSDELSRYVFEKGGTIKRTASVVCYYVVKKILVKIGREVKINTKGRMHNMELL